jgi:peptidylprolyl isomerase
MRKTSRANSGAPPGSNAPERSAPRDVFLILETERGTMRIVLFPELAPVHCAHVAALARAGRYDGLTWHRVVPDFVIQGGCPRGDGSGSAGVSLPLEPTFVPFQRGTLGMPRSGNPDSGGCQLFICHSRAPHLDTAYTAFGRVVEGLDVIDRIDVDTKIVRARIEGAR